MPAADASNDDLQAPRFSDRPFPAYAHIPGVTPHPIREPAGHSYKVRTPDVSPPDPEDWRACPMYCWGIDLFNAGFYWEAHEAWESVWIAAGRRGPLADFLKALIKLAAAGVKLREGTPAGARRHLRRALELLELVTHNLHPADNRCLGLPLAPLRKSCEHLLAGPLPERPPRDGRPDPILQIDLHPGS